MRKFSYLIVSAILLCPAAAGAEIWRCAAGSGSFTYVNNLEYAKDPDACTKPKLPELGRYSSLRSMSGLQKIYGNDGNGHKQKSAKKSVSLQQEPYYEDVPDPAPFILSPRERKARKGGVSNFRGSNYRDLKSKGHDAGEGAAIDDLDLSDLGGLTGAQPVEMQQLMEQMDNEEILRAVDSITEALGSNSNLQDTLRKVQERNQIFDNAAP